MNVVRNIAKVGYAAFGLAGTSAIKMSSMIGQQAVNVGKTAFSATVALTDGTLNMLNSSSPLKNPIGQIPSIISKTADKMISNSPRVKVWNASAKVMNTQGGLNLTKTGVGTIGLTASIGGLWDAKNNYESNKMGQMDSGVTTATPSYLNDAGATGDLVFALNANRRG